MPRPIKKKISKHDTATEETVRTFMSVATEKVESNLRQVVIVAAAVLAVIIAVAGFFYARGGVEEKSAIAFYDGYKSYYGLYEAQALPPVARYERSLESFKRSNEAKSSPEALLYMANSQEQLGMYEDALASLREMESRFGGNDILVPLAIYKTAMVQLKAGKSDEALGTFERLYNYENTIYKDLALVEQARVLEGLGKHEEAVTKYNSILAEFPESPFIEEARIRTGKVEEEEAAGSTGTEGSVQ
jgi:tetratricopeptide (TPR) repeat protein